MKISGTKEWAKYNVNCVNGCSHNCRYCYARYSAVNRYKRIEPGEWEKMKVRLHDISPKRKLMDGTIMFPTTHDITPDVLQPCLEVLLKMLGAGNNVLIVSKPHFECIVEICKQCEQFKKQILFRFTIGAMDNKILKYWEPGAPSFEERLKSLEYAFNSGFATSVSCEPMLDSDRMVELFHVLKPYVTNSIWIGKLNKYEKRVEVKTDDDRIQIERIVKGQTDERVKEIYSVLKDEPLVKWKESFKEVLGLKLAEEEGEDK